MKRASAIGVITLGALALLVLYARPRFVPLPGAKPPADQPAPGVPPVPPPVEPPRELPPPPTVMAVLDALNKEVEGGLAAVRNLTEVLDQLEKGTPPASAKISALGSKIGTFKIGDESPNLARCADEVLSVQFTDETRRGIARSIREVGKRIEGLRKTLAPALERVALLKAKPDPAWAEALTGLEAELLRYDRALLLSGTTAEAESNRVDVR